MDYRALAAQIAQQEGVPTDLFLRLVNQESGFQPDVTSSAGAHGLTQLMPGTASDLGVDPRDPVQNLTGGARYLRQQLDRFGTPELALAAYNAGPGNVSKYGGIPPFEETQNYVRAILGGSAPAQVSTMGASMPNNMPQGLLGAQPEQPQQQQSGFWNNFLGGALADPDRRARIGMALQGMTMNPNSALVQAAQSGIDERKQGRIANRTIEWLAQQPGGEAYVQMIQAGGSPAAVLQAYQQAQAPRETFQTLSGQQLIDMGMQGANPNALYKVNQATGEISQVGGAGVTVNTGNALTPFDEAAQKFQVQMWGDLATNAPTAQATLGQVELLDTLLKESGSGFSQGLSKFVYDTTGFDAQGSAASAANALINQLVPAQRPQGSGTMSDADLALYKGSLPQLQRSPEGNQIILDGMRALAQYNLATSRIAAQVLNGQMTPQEGDAAVVALGNPLADVNARIRQQGQGGTAGAGGAPVAGDIIDGYRFKGGNPADQNNWEPI